MYIDKLLSLIGYNSDYISENLILESMILERENGTLILSFASKTPIDYHELNNLVDALNTAKITGINSIDYSFKLESYSQDDVMNYYSYIVNNLSKDDYSFISASSFSKNYDENAKTLTINVPSADSSVVFSKKKIISDFNKYGFSDLNLNFNIIDLDDTIKNDIEAAKKRIQLDAQSSVSKKDEVSFLIPGRDLIGERITINELPDNLEEFYDFKSKPNARNAYIVSGTIELNDADNLEKRNTAKFIVKDETGYIYAQKRARSNEEIKFLGGVKVGSWVEMQCYPMTNKIGDVYMNIVNMKVSKDIKPITTREDNEPKKRVELHVHTKMSQLDGVPFMKQYCECATKWGHKAIACTDHGSVQAFNELYKYCEAHPELKPIYGAEFSFVDEKRVLCAYDPKHIDLDEATYVVYDFETTGFSVNYEKPIELSAVKISKNVIIGQFSELVNPEKTIPAPVVALTGITNADVKNARSRREVITDFYNFCKGSILVAHNAQFDIGHLYKNLEDLGIEHEKFPVIDTLYLAKVLYPDHKSYGLDACCKLLGVVLENHHRALQDATATGEVFLHMLVELKKLGIKYHDEINSLIDPKEAIKLPVRPGHINLIARTQQGLTNLYHITSIANTECFTRDPIATRSVIEKYHEGILVGSGCRNSYFFDVAFRESEENLEKIIDFYDYIEVQPPSRFEYQKDSIDNWYYCITDTIKRIIRVAKKHGIPVVATGDCHQINKEDTIYRDILVNYTTKSSAYRHYLKDPKRSTPIPDEYFMTTREMLDEFAFLGEQLAYEIVVTNTNMIADSCEFVKSFSNKPLPPKDDFMKDRGIPSAEQYVKETVYNKAHELYGDMLPGIVMDRIEHELKPIMDNKFSTIYLISQLLVNKSREDGYVVGSRGSVGSSFIANLMDITEVNSLPPHYRCPNCHYTAFKYNEEEKNKYGIRPDEEQYQELLQNTQSGFDLPDANCPICGHLMDRDGHDIPFETFLGVPENPKTPDIDLNFSGENQGQIHNYIRELFGYTKAFRAGTILTCQSKIAFAIVRDYFDQINERREKEGLDKIEHRKAEIEALAQGITECKKSSSQHPGGIVVVPMDHEVYEVTPVQYPGDSTDRSWMTTHFDYHTFEKNFFKLDVLGHDDPTVIRYLMRYVQKYPHLFPFKDAFHIPVNDHKVYQMMNDTTVLGVQPQDINTPVATYGISEFGTSFVRGLLEETRPKTFAGLVKISGLSHGTDVYQNNAQDLLKGANGMPKIPFDQIIGCRDDIMLDLISFGTPADKAFSTMEFVRKGNAPKDPEKWAKIVDDLSVYPNIPKWYIMSCSKIKYMFPKAHAVAYIIMALRIAWFKLYQPIFFYSAIMSKKMTSYSIEVMVGGVARIKEELQRLNSIPQNDRKQKEEDLITTLELALEMTVRGYKFYNVNLYKSDATDFAVSDDLSGLYMPFTAIDGLGEASAQTIVDARKEGAFETIKDFQQRCQVSSTNFEKMRDLGVFDGMQEDDQLTLDLGI